MDPDRSTPVPERLRFEAVGASNDVVLELAEQGVAEHTTVLADRLTKARGGNGPWHAPPGGLWMSILWRPGLPLEAAPRLTLAAVWGLREGIRKATGVAAGIKWPNDLVVEGRKLGGVLVEGGVREDRVPCAAVGLRANVNNPVQELPGPVAESACSLEEISGCEHDLSSLEEEVTESLREARSLLEDPEALLANVDACWTQKGSPVRMDLGHMFVEGRGEELTRNGGIRVASEDALRTVEDPSVAKFVRIVETAP